MSERLAPVVVELTQDALLKAFWFKASLRQFLKLHGVTDKELLAWHDEQSKRDYVQWLWLTLVDSERGHQIILEIARTLAKMRVFPDLERKEDTRIRISEAQEATARLKEAVETVEVSLQDRREAERRRKAAREQVALKAAAQQSLAKIGDALHALIPQLGTSPGGLTFERWFYDLAVYFEMDARPGYKVKERQIDGAITLDGTTFLIETKFTKEPIGSPDVDVFMSKIESKADNTMGIMISIAGFTSGAVSEASKRRTPMLLLDHSHLFGLVLPGVMGLPQVVARVRRHASQTGAAFLAVTDF